MNAEGPGVREEWRGREMYRRAHLRGPGRPRPPMRRHGFGCLFGILFLVIVASVIATIGSLLTTLGVVPFIVAALVILVLLAGLARVLSRSARDLDRLLAATRRVKDGDYSVRMGTTRSRMAPVRELASGFDTMVARLEADEEQRRSLLADVSHELRTPLAVITGNLEAIIDGVYPADTAHLAPILDETRVMERLIDDLRTIALSEGGTLPLHPEPADPDVIIGEVVRAFAASADAGGVQLKVEVQGDLPILEIDPVRIREVIATLVANALRHTPRGGTVAIGGSATKERVTILVRDTGPGIEPLLLPHVFDRFVKGSTSRGTGLGL
ncbi:MAG: ATP-binding protein, partial [Candidatus Limnocylindrales bacterium]